MIGDASSPLSLKRRRLTSIDPMEAELYKHTKENPCGSIPPAMQVKETDTMREEAITTTLRRAISSIPLSHDGHWPAESSGTLFFSSPWVMTLYVTRSLNVVLSAEHQKKIIRYIYNHQERDLKMGRTWLRLEAENGRLTMAVCWAFHHGERFLECMSGQAATHYPQNYGFSQRVFPIHPD